jgi:hypothetical protein
MYQKICPDCKKDIIYDNYKTYHSAKMRDSVCRSCRTIRANKSDKRNVKMENNPAWKGYKEIPYGWFSKYFERGNKKNHRTGDITIQQIYDIWIKQNKKCALSNVDIDFIQRDKIGISASIDRIDSKKEYVIDNVQLVHKDVNLMKNHYDQNYFIKMCKLIVNHNEVK